MRKELLKKGRRRKEEGEERNLKLPGGLTRKPLESTLQIKIGTQHDTSVHSSLFNK